MTERPVGIDLGTTYSAVAFLDDALRPVTVRNAEGDLTTPSLVLFEDAEVVVGKEAFKAVPREADHVADCAKRDMGRKVYRRPIRGKEFPPEVIQAFVLKKLREDAARQIDECRRAVITVPAYFDESRRRATVNAAYMAGLEALDIINEPVAAAALAYGVDRGFLSPRGLSMKRQTMLVYDLGGGTFDVTVMAVDGAEFSTLATDGDVQLGGRDWDSCLCDFVAQRFADAHGFDPRRDANCAGALWQECEEAKRTLSSRQKAVVACDFRGRSLTVEVTRAQFEDMTRYLLDRTEFTVCQVLRAAELDWGSLDRILLIGGSTRMPMVATMLEQLSGKRVDRSASPDEAVAHGAAIYAGLLLDKQAGRKPQFRISNVNPHSLGVVGFQRSVGEKRVKVLIPRNTSLPASSPVKEFKTKSQDQRNVIIQVVEGESERPEGCTAVGEVVKDLPPNLPAGTTVGVRFSYGSNAMISVDVQVDKTKPARFDIQHQHGLSPAELDSWRACIEKGRWTP